jgi:hypothetical protein
VIFSYNYLGTVPLPSPATTPSSEEIITMQQPIADEQLTPSSSSKRKHSLNEVAMIKDEDIEIKLERDLDWGPVPFDWVPQQEKLFSVRLQNVPAKGVWLADPFFWPGNYKKKTEVPAKAYAKLYLALVDKDGTEVKVS